jgi:nucleoid-associated protein Lsr2
MAQKVTVSLEDDLTGGPATETVAFAFDGTSYEIDLNAKNASEFRKGVTPFMEHARKAAGTATRRRAAASPGQSRPGRSSEARANSSKIRAWATSSEGRAVLPAGVDVSERGRIPAAVIEAYNARTTAPSPVRPAADTPPAAPAPSDNGAAAKPKVSEVRKWAKANGIDVPDRGSIKPEITAQYQASLVTV